MTASGVISTTPPWTKISSAFWATEVGVSGTAGAAAGAPALAGGVAGVCEWTGAKAPESRRSAAVARAYFITGLRMTGGFAGGGVTRPAAGACEVALPGPQKINGSLTVYGFLANDRWGRFSADLQFQETVPPGS